MYLLFTSYLLYIILNMHFVVTGYGRIFPSSYVDRADFTVSSPLLMLHVLLLNPESAVYKLAASRLSFLE